jgi:hypothetical protein
MIESEGPLLAIAEISVALAGFASIVVAIRGASPTRWSRQDRYGLANVFASSVCVLLASVLPFPLHALGVSDAGLWSLSNGVLAGMLFLYLTFLAIRQKSSPPRIPWLFWSLVGMGWLIAAILLLASVGVLDVAGPGLLLVGLIYALMSGFAQLATFLLLSTSDD